MMEWILSSSVLILIMMGLRQILKGKISLRLQYALWAIVLIRLLVSFHLAESPVSVLNVTRQPQVQAVVESVREPIRVEWQDVILEERTGETHAVQNTSFVADGEDLGHFYTPGEILIAVWKWGVVFVLGFMLTSNLIFCRKLSRERVELEAEEIDLPVYLSRAAETPCLVGLRYPAVYLPEEPLDPVRRRHVLEHEMTHYRHGDHITAVLRCVALALHWYNPLVWWAAKASKADGELACDEGTIARLGEGERIPYGKTLMEMTCGQGKNNVMLTATTMTGSKKTLKERITRIAKKPRMAAITLIVVIVVMAVAVGCSFTGAKKIDPMAELTNEELIQKVEQMEDPQEIEDIIVWFSQQRDCEIRVYQKNDYGRKGKGHELDEDLSKAIASRLSKYQWSRVSEVMAITESDQWVEMVIDLGADGPWWILLQCSPLEPDLVWLSFFGLDGNGKITCTAENILLRAQPETTDPNAADTAGMYYYMDSLFGAQQESLKEQTIGQQEDRFPPLLNHSEESLEILQMLTEMVENTRANGEGTIRLMVDGEALILNLEDAQYDTLLHFFDRYVWKEMESWENLDGNGVNVMGLTLNYTQEERYVVHIGTWDNPSDIVRIIWVHMDDNAREEIRCFTASARDENAPATLFDALYHVFQDQHREIQLEISDEEQQLEKYDFITAVGQIMEENQGAGISYVNPESPILRFELSEAHLDRLLELFNEYTWTIEIMEMPSSADGTQIDVWFLDGTVLSINEYYVGILRNGDNSWQVWYSQPKNQNEKWMYSAAKSFLEEVFLEGYDQEESEEITEFLYNEILAMQGQAVISSIINQDIAEYDLSDLETRFCAEMMRSVLWEEGYADIYTGQGHYYDCLLEGNGCRIAYYGNQSLIEYTRDGISRYFCPINTDFTHFSLRYRMEEVFHRSDKGGGAYSFEGVDGQQAAKLMVEKLPQLLESFYGDQAGLKAENITVLDAQWDPYDHYDTTITYNVQISIPEDVYHAMQLGDLEVEKDSNSVIVKLRFSVEGANEKFWICDWLRIGDQNLIPS